MTILKSISASLFVYVLTMGCQSWANCDGLFVDPEFQAVVESIAKKVEGKTIKYQYSNNGLFFTFELEGEKFLYSEAQPELSGFILNYDPSAFSSYSYFQYGLGAKRRSHTKKDVKYFFISTQYEEGKEDKILTFILPPLENNEEGPVIHVSLKTGKLTFHTAIQNYFMRMLLPKGEWFLRETLQSKPSRVRNLEWRR